MKTTFKLAGISLIALLATTALASQPIRVMINGDPVEFTGQEPIMTGDRVMVPLRGVLEKMHVHVDWDPATQTVTAHRGGIDVTLKIGNKDASVSGHPITLDVPAQVIDGSTMVPLRFIGEALGQKVHWEENTQTVRIDTHGDVHGSYDVPNHPKSNGNGGGR